MKKLVASVGLVAVGASGVHTASAVDLTTEGAKPWSVFATLRGFYDDNINTVPSSSPYHTDSLGWEISPGLNLNWTGEQTTFTLGFVYSYLYYENPPAGQAGKNDQTYSFQTMVNHKFNEEYWVKVQDSFVIGQEPDYLRAGPIFGMFQRVPGNNIRNYGGLLFHGDLSRRFGVELGYDNVYFHYQDSGAVTNGYVINLNPPSVVALVSPSQGGLLDRLENRGEKSSDPLVAFLSAGGITAARKL